eukprot:11688157-Alexandrium_andersonii.AAC.1
MHTAQERDQRKGQTDTRDPRDMRGVGAKMQALPRHDRRRGSRQSPPARAVSARLVRRATPRRPSAASR